MPTISIIIVNWNTRQMLLDCIASIVQNARHSEYEIIVVDNASTDGSVEELNKAFPRVQIIRNPVNLGFAKANNIGIRRMQGKYAVLLNSDTLVLEGAIESLHDFMEVNTDAGICGPQLLNADGSHQKSYDRFPTVAGEFTSKSLQRLFFPHAYQMLSSSSGETTASPFPVDFILGACMFIRKESLEKAGMLDEDYFFYYEEMDLCFRMQNAGWRVYHVPGSRVVHFGGGSSKGLNLRARAESWRSRYLFFAKSLTLSAFERFLLYAAGFMHLCIRSAGYLLANTLTLFVLPRLRNRLKMFAYLILWHLRGFPLSMCLARGRQ